MGVTAVAMALLAPHPSSARSWILVWPAEAIGAAMIGALGHIRQSPARGNSDPGAIWHKVFADVAASAFGGSRGFQAPSMLRGLAGCCPASGCFFMAWGSSPAGSFSVSIVPVMGVSFMVAGGAALLCPASWANTLMALGFGRTSHLIRNDCCPEVWWLERIFFWRAPLA